MADLYVLEGRGNFLHARPKAHRNMHVTKRRHVMRRVPGIVYGDPMDVLLGRSLWAKAKSIGKSAVKLAVAPVTTAYTVTKSAAKATGHAVLHPSLKNISRIATDPTKRAFNETKSNVKEVAHMTAETGRFVNTAASRSMDVIRRVAKRLIKKVAKKVLFKGDLMGADTGVARISKGAAKGILIPVATAAVAANTTTAPAAPIVPVLVNEVIDELYSAIEKGIKKGLSPKQAEDEAKAELDKLEPGEENDPKVSYGSYMPIAIGLAAVIGLVVVMKKKKS